MDELQAGRGASRKQLAHLVRRDLLRHQLVADGAAVILLQPLHDALLVHDMRVVEARRNRLASRVVRAARKCLVFHACRRVSASLCSRFGRRAFRKRETASAVGRRSFRHLAFAIAHLSQLARQVRDRLASFEKVQAVGAAFNRFKRLCGCCNICRQVLNVVVFEQVVLPGPVCFQLRDDRLGRFRRLDCQPPRAAAVREADQARHQNEHPEEQEENHQDQVVAPKHRYCGHREHINLCVYKEAISFNVGITCEENCIACRAKHDRIDQRRKYH